VQIQIDRSLCGRFFCFPINNYLTLEKTCTMKISHYKPICVLVVLFCLAACGQNDESTLKTAMKDKFFELNPDIKEVNISDIKLEHTVSLGDELNRREALFMTKVKYHTEKRDKYLAARKPLNASIHREKLQQAEAILADINQYRQEHSASLDSTVYYVFSLTANAKKTDGTKIKDSKLFCSVTPEYEIYNLISNGNSYKGMGFTIPGYKAILKSHKLEEEAE